MFPLTITGRLVDLRDFRLRGWFDSFRVGLGVESVWESFCESVVDSDP